VCPAFHGVGYLDSDVAVPTGGQAREEQGIRQDSASECSVWSQPDARSLTSRSISGSANRGSTLGADGTASIADSTQGSSRRGVVNSPWQSGAPVAASATHVETCGVHFPRLMSDADALEHPAASAISESFHGS